MRILFEFLELVKFHLIPASIALLWWFIESARVVAVAMPIGVLDDFLDVFDDGLFKLFC